jgi:hypothetical protein
MNPLINFILIVTGVSLFIYACLYAAGRRKNKSPLNQTHIMVTGTAQNKDGFAKVVVDVADTYCIDGMQLWQNDWLNKKIKVVGDLEICRQSQVHKICCDTVDIKNKLLNPLL